MPLVFRDTLEQNHRTIVAEADELYELFVQMHDFVGMLPEIRLIRFEQHDVFGGVGDVRAEEVIPVVIGKHEAVELFDLMT